MTSSEIGSAIVLPLFKDAAAHGAGAGEMFKQRIAIVPTDRALHRRQVFRKALEHFQHRLFVGQEHVAPLRWVGRRNTGELAYIA